MYQLNQHRHPSALPPPLLVIVILTTLLTIPGLAWPSEGPTHSSHYDQLKNSIAALSAEVNSIVSIIDTLKTLQGRTPQTAPPPISPPADDNPRPNEKSRHATNSSAGSRR